MPSPPSDAGRAPEPAHQPPEYQAATLEKVARLGKLLRRFEGDPRLAGQLALKGGTALNLALAAGAPPRLSEDVDVNYVGREDRAGMEAARGTVEGAVVEHASALGYEVRAGTDAHAGRKFSLRYRRAGGGEDWVAVDLNFLHRVPLGPPARRALWQPPGAPPTAVTTASPEEIAGGKVTAALARATPRDLVDLPTLRRVLGPAWEAPRTRGVVVAMAGMLPRALDTYYAKIAAWQLQARDVRAHLAPLLPRGADVRPEAVVAAARAVAEPLVRLTPAERAFHDALHGYGELRPEFLFPDDPEMADRIARSPVLRWKAANARAHRARTHPGSTPAPPARAVPAEGASTDGPAAPGDTQPRDDGPGGGMAGPGSSTGTPGGPGRAR